MYEVERISGLIADLLDGDGGPEYAAMLACHVCGARLAVDPDGERRTMTLTCPVQAGHFRWYGSFTRLPDWLAQVSHHAHRIAAIGSQEF